MAGDYNHDGETDDVESLCSRAQALIDVKRSAEAIPLLQQAITLDPDDVYPRCLLGLAYIRAHQPALALRAAEEAIRIDPAEEWAHRLRSSSLSTLGKKRQALEAAREAVRLAPDLPEALFTLAQSALANRRMQEARETAATLLRVAPDRASSHELLGSIALEDNKHPEAELHYRSALAIDPQSWAALNDLGVALLRQGRKREAVDYFHAAAQLDPSEETSRSNLKLSVDSYLERAFPNIPSTGAWAVLRIVAILSWGVVGLLGWLAFLGGRAVWSFVTRHRRLAELHPTVAAFYQEEHRRARSRWREDLFTISLLVGVVITLLWTLAWIQDGAREAGLSSWGLVPYLLIAGGTVAGIIRWVLKARSRG
jgi:Flp pilus assembly protein TadD